MYNHFYRRQLDSDAALREKAAEVRDLLSRYDTVVIGAGAGLSTSAGFTYSGERFRAHFADFADKYGFADMYSGGFYPYGSLEEFWAYWSRYISINRYEMPPKPVYQWLLGLVERKDYFVLTTNVDHCFQRAGVDKARLFYTQGDYGLFQCSQPCHAKTYDNEAQVRAMLAEQKEMRIPTELVPHCPVCGKPMAMNLRADGTFVEDDGWNAAAERYQSFLRRHVADGVLFLELGVGGNTPGIIKYPFQQLVAQHQASYYVCINYGEAASPAAIGARSLCINGDIGAVLELV